MEVNTKMPIESKRARISFSDSTNSLTLAQDEGPGRPSKQHNPFLSKKNRPNSTMLQALQASLTSGLDQTQRLVLFCGVKQQLLLDL